MYSLKRYQGVRIVLIFNDFLYFQRWGETFYIPTTFNGRETYTNKEIEIKIVENYIKYLLDTDQINKNE